MTPAPFVAACDRFVYLELLSDEPDEPTTVRPELRPILSAAIEGTAKDDGWSSLSRVGSMLVNTHAAFDPRDYGVTKLGELVRREDYVEVKVVPLASGLSQLWVRLVKR